MTRRDILARSGYGIGAAALHALLAPEAQAGTAFPNHKARAKRVIFLFQAGGPSQIDLFDHKPFLKDRFNQDIPPSIFGGQRVTGDVLRGGRHRHGVRRVE